MISHLLHSRKSPWGLQLQRLETIMRKKSASVETRTVDLWRQRPTHEPLRRLLRLSIMISEISKLITVPKPIIDTDIYTYKADNYSRIFHTVLYKSRTLSFTIYLLLPHNYFKLAYAPSQVAFPLHCVLGGVHAS